MVAEVGGVPLVPRSLRLLYAGKEEGGQGRVKMNQRKDNKNRLPQTNKMLDV